LSLPGRREKLRQACRFKWGKVVGDAISSPFKIPGYLKQQLRVNQFLFSSVFGRKKFVWPRFESLAKDYPKDERLFLAELYHSFAGNTSSEIPSLIKRIQARVM
jgi:hypothetical protein